METNIFIEGSEDPSGTFSSSRPSSSQQPQVKRYILVVLVVLATAGISAGITYTCVQKTFENTEKRKDLPSDLGSKGNTTKWKCYLKEHHRVDKKIDYEIFTVPKYGDYFIHGLVWKIEEEHSVIQDYVWLEKKLQSYDEIAMKTFCDSHVILPMNQRE